MFLCLHLNHMLARTRLHMMRHISPQSRWGPLVAQTHPPSATQRILPQPEPSTAAGGVAPQAGGPCPGNLVANAQRLRIYCATIQGTWKRFCGTTRRHCGTW
jgi:hypothetical protein